jgi:hypothetical protein
MGAATRWPGRTGVASSVALRRGGPAPRGEGSDPVSAESGGRWTLHGARLARYAVTFRYLNVRANRKHGETRGEHTLAGRHQCGRRRSWAWSAKRRPLFSSLAFLL